MRRTTLLSDILPDRGLDIAASQRVRGFVVGSHLVSSFVEMRLAQRIIHGGNVRQGLSPACGEG